VQCSENSIMKATVTKISFTCEQNEKKIQIECGVVRGIHKNTVPISKNPVNLL
jgi:hypothetical protein